MDKADFWFQNRWLQHLLFWGLSFYILLRIFAYDFPPQKVDYIYTLLFHLSLWVGVYVNLFLLIPFILAKGRYYLYGLCFILVALLIIALNILTFEFLSDWLFPGFYFISYYHFGDLIQFSLAYLSITTLLKLSKAWFEVNKKNKEIQILKTQKLNAELAALKHQLNPHLLFNNLNAIYNMILDQNPKAGDALLYLSDNMRYVLYETNTALIPISREIAFIENYIALQKLRVFDQEYDIEFEYDKEITAEHLAPLIFLPFIENAFKHGFKSRPPIIHIKLQKDSNQLIFFIKNSKTKTKKDFLPKEYSGGIGLSNVKKRLEKHYADKYTLDISEEEETFIVKLSITI